jgi:hypothetical protein
MSAAGAGSTSWQKVIDRFVKIERRLRELERPGASQIRGTSQSLDALREATVAPDGSKLYTKDEVDQIIATVNSAQVQLREDLESRIAKLEGAGDPAADGAAGA